MPEITVPQGSAELEEFLNDASKMRQLFNQDGSAKPEFSQLVKSYTRSQMSGQGGEEITAQVREQVQLAAAELSGQTGRRVNLGATGQLAELDRVPQGWNPRTIYNRAAVGVAANGIFDGDNPADYFQAIWHKKETLRNRTELAQKLEQLQQIQNTFSSTVPSDGGFLIPEEMRAEILRLSLQSSVVRPRARVLPMSSLTLSVPSIDETTHASSVFGGVVAYWTAESAGLTESSAKFGRTKLEAHKLTVYSEVPNELVADAPAFGALIGQLFPEAIAWYEDKAFTEGSGVGEPLGFTNAAATISVTRDDTDDVLPVVYADIVGMYSRMLPSSLGSAVWVVSPEVVPSLLQMVLATGNATIPVVSPPLLLEGQQAIQTPPMTILGRPVLVSEHMPQSDAANDIMFVDLSYYLIGDRQAMTADSSPHYRFANDETAYRVIERVDGRPWIQSAITPANGGDTLSPFVGLGAQV